MLLPTQMRIFLFLATVIATCSNFAPADADETQVRIEFFEKNIRPVLVQHCYKCHSNQSDNVKGGLRLDSRQAIRRGGDSGPAIDGANSLLLSALRYEELEMPPAGKLDPAVIADFEKWISWGAPDPRNEKPTDPAKETQTSARELWSLQPIEKPAFNQSEAAPYQTAIDQFAISQLEQQNARSTLQPSLVLRRLYFDLIGLPPTVEEIADFELRIADWNEGLANHSETQIPKSAFESVVDRLLASPQFGRRWARSWLDVVRYSESNGGDRNVVWPHAWRYRDWVVDALNSDMPYDQFIREQIAGDLLPAETAEQRDRQLVATGMLTLGPKLFMETKSEKFLMDVVDEQIDVVSRAILGLTVSCARCHDHKFDPIPTRDYYALAGIFRSTFLQYGPAAPAGNQYGHDRPLQPIGKDAEKLKGPADAHLKAVADQTSVRNKARSDRYRVVRKKAAQQNKLKMLREKGGTDSEIKSLTDEIAKLEAEIKDWDEKVKNLDEQLQKLVDNPPPFPDYAMAVSDEEKCENCRICIRGEHNKLGDVVERGILNGIEGPAMASISPSESGRLQLADWLVDPKNPLTPRVAVNRIWQNLFGEGLVATSDNFGSAGMEPSNLKLLDYLAARLIEHRWSVKSLIREIALSRTYLEFATPRRLEAEAIRDSILAASGRLDLSGAKSVVSTIDSREFNATVKLSDEQLENSHRSIYLPVVRYWLPKVMTKFDFADPSLVVGRREQRTMHSQQLFLLNDPWVLEQSKFAARRLLSETPSPNLDRVELAYRRFFGRRPTSAEIAQSVEFIKRIEEEAVASEELSAPEYAWMCFCQALLASAEFRYLE